MIKTKRGRALTGVRQFVYLSKQTFYIFPFVYLITVSQFAIAKPIVTPIVEIKEVFVDTERDTSTESGQVTTISPGVSINSTGPKADVDLIYNFDAISYHGLDDEDREIHRLGLNSRFRHKPDWASYVRAANRLTYENIDGTQSANPDIISDNSRELFTIDAGSTYSGRLTRNVQYSSSLTVDYADQEDNDTSSGHGIALSMDSFISQNVLTWRVQAESNVAESDGNDSEIDELEVVLSYRFDQQLNGFLEFTTTDTDFSELNEDTTLIGLNWQPTRRSFVRAGLGKRGDDDSFDLDARITRAHSVFSASYSEDVESVRNQVFDLQESEVAQSTNQSIEITPILRKQAEIAMTLIGVRSTITTSIFRDEESNEDLGIDEEVTGGEIEFNRRLSPHSSLSLRVLSQDTESTEKSTLEEFRVSYEKTIFENAGFETYLSHELFESTDSTIEFEQSTAGVSFRAKF